MRRKAARVEYNNIQVSPGNVKLHFSQRQGGGPPGASPLPTSFPASTHSLRCSAMPWRLRRKVRLQLGQKKAMAKWSETSDINHFHEVMVEFIHNKLQLEVKSKKADSGETTKMPQVHLYIENEGNAECIFVATIGWSPTVSCHYPKFPPLNVFKQHSQKSHHHHSQPIPILEFNSFPPPPHFFHTKPSLEPPHAIPR